MLLGNYIVFTLLVIAVFVLALVLSFAGVETNLVDLRQVGDYDAQLSSGRYDEFPVRRLLGEGGSIAVLDSRGGVVYNPVGMTIDLSPEETAYIPDVLSEYSIFTNELKTAGGQTNYEITISGEGQSQLFILDQDFRLLYGSGGLLRGPVSEKKYRLLSNTSFEGYSVRKHPFAAEGGEAHTLLLFWPDGRGDQTLQNLADSLSRSSEYFLLLYVLLIVLLIFWLRRKISRPLNLLCGAFRDYQIGGQLVSRYRGPREFVEIFDRFSDMARRLEDSERRRRTLEETRRKMLAGIAHDLKTPVAVIQGYARALGDGVIPPEERSRCLAALEQKAAGLNEQINAFYEYSRLEHPDFSLNLELGDICCYFRDFVAEQYSDLELAGFSLEVDIPETRVSCMIDRGQLKRAFANIVGNAVKHTPRGTTLYFALSVEGESAVLTLADNGPGIPAGVAPDIFTPFVMGDASRGGTGSGLGLSIAKRIVETHGGSIRLGNSSDSRWSTVFEITLPIQSA